MIVEKQEILAKLRQQLLEMQGYKSLPEASGNSFGLGPIESCFPTSTFPTGTIHEFLAESPEEAAASEGFMTGLLSKLMENGRSCLWISQERKLFPPSLEIFGADPQHIIFIDLNYKKDILWVLEEALKCEGLACVIAELPDVDFAQSRRLQLVTEKSHVTGFILRKRSKSRISATACTARWAIKPYPSATINNLPGVGNPRWEINLIKVKNAEGGTFLLEWADNRFLPVESSHPVVLKEEKEKIA
ncbi:ImuA family protein [Pedobacter sp. Leaf132]|uniref:ImuA family protein n=1 Tax=Pedobacter sp. Leaf132 TaxID=2876557 RepID=UPI001E30BD6F|nr:Error-prone repair protein ImuA [Pedobacter sp. Leaf132]